MGQVPAATKTLRVLRFLASQPEPTSIDRIMRACGLPRSTAYHLLTAMAEEGFVVHLADDHRWGLGVAAFEVGSGYTRQEPLQRIARRLLADLADTTGQSAHLAVLHGRDVLYVVEERAPGRPPLVTDVGVRLPAHLTASGRAILAELPAAQVRALYPSADAFVDRHGTGPRTLSRLRTLLADTRQRGFAIEEGEVTPGARQRRLGGPRPQRPPGRGGRADVRRRRRRGARGGRAAYRLALATARPPARWPGPPVTFGATLSLRVQTLRLRREPHDSSHRTDRRASSRC